MNGLCKTLDCFYGAAPTDDDRREFIAVKVGKDGNQIVLSEPCRSVEEAEEIARQAHATDLQDNGQFGVGA